MLGKLCPALAAFTSKYGVGRPKHQEQLRECSTPAALSIAQILKYNSIKHMCKEVDATLSVRHNPTQETSLLLYIELMLHAKTQKRDLVDKLFNLDLSISCDHVLRLSAEMGNSVCQRFHVERVVCPSMLKSNMQYVCQN